ncbi:barstar family protein [Litoreibacter halocynthiae]|uniref:barstar family protein n=1 Tax=Litoreibacter halocynthiae TaxID=1242689 RepID=UPI0024909233|nr:barstar family protein [Litoreibacter halocynthiae]
MNKLVVIDCAQIKGWPSFHDVFSEAFGFPDFYGKNRDAWIDCMTCLDEEFSKVFVGNGEFVTLQLDNVQELKVNSPKILNEIFEMVGFVNYRRVEQGDLAVLAVSCSI